MSKINEYPLLCQIGPEHPNLLALADAVCRHESHLDAWIALGVTRCFAVPGCYIIQQPSTRVASAVNGRSEEHTSELQSLMRISYVVFCLNKKSYYNMTHLNSIYSC